jgi:putative aminopeptidase FrvX
VPIPDLLRELLTAAGPTGHEEAASRVWRRAASAFAEVTSDTLGTSFARIAAGGRSTLALVGHIDEVGIAITTIDAEGRLWYATLGSIDPEVLVGQRVVLSGREGPVDGVLVSGENRPKGGESALCHADLYVDIGARSEEEAAARVSVGAAGVWRGDPLELPNGRIVSKALDNRLGAYVVLEAARRVAEAGDARVDVVAVATVQEELGHQGARTAAFALAPEVALAVDVTWATDVPGADPRRAGRIELGAGAAITRGPAVNRHVADLLVRAAEEEGIAHAFEVYSGRTQTDADDLHVARGGVPTGVISVPIRYMHSPCELASLDDVEAVIALAVAFARRLAPETSFLR